MNRLALIARVLVGLLLVLVLVVVALCAIPLAPAGLDAHPRPARSYAEALAKIGALAALDGPDVSPDGRTRAFLHGAKTGRAIVFLHGLTNCPAQFDSLARLAFARGDNVLVPRLPRHGLKDRMTSSPAELTAGELCAATDAAIDAAQGLGDRVTVAGLSVGGTLAAWAGQERGDVDRVVLVAPMFGVAMAPGVRGGLLLPLAARLPNLFVWWDSDRKEALRGPRHVYPRFATRAIAATLEVAARVHKDALARAPGARSAELVTLANDPAVDNRATFELLHAWRDTGMRDLHTFAFPGTLHLSHDLVDPAQVGANPGLTYPVLLAALHPGTETTP